jgi:cation diffusion facilitator family transporter
VVGVGVIQLTGWNRLDPIIALLVALNIIRVGLDLVRRSMLGLLDTALPVAERQAIEAVLARHRASEGIQAHALRTRQAGQRRFGSVHILVPGKWSVQRGHMLLDRIEQEIGAAVPGIMLVTHLESLEDPRSWEDETLP